MSGPDIFISYSREDRAAARHFAECFAREGFSVWWDAALHSGETFDEVIENELKAAKAVVVLWSPRSVTSRWVRAEATLADRRNKLAPVIIEPCDRPIIFELTHTTDLSNWTGDPSDGDWQTFIQDLHRFVERGKLGAPAASSGRGRPEPAARARPEPPADRFTGRFGGATPPPPAKTENRLFTRSGRQATAPPPDDDDDDYAPTQFYTRSDGPDLLGGNALHCLELTIGDKLEKRYIVSPPGLKIGRTAPADIVLADARVSRSHCMIELTGDQLKVLDLNSTNGTFVDGERIDGATILEVGSLLRVGNITFKHEVRSRAEV